MAQKDRVSRVRDRASRIRDKANRVAKLASQADRPGRAVSDAGRAIGQVALAQADDAKAQANRGTENAVNKSRRELIQVSTENTYRRTAPSFIDDGRPAFFSSFDQNRSVKKKNRNRFW